MPIHLMTYVQCPRRIWSNCLATTNQTLCPALSCSDFRSQMVPSTDLSSYKSHAGGNLDRYIDGLGKRAFSRLPSVYQMYISSRLPLAISMRHNQSAQVGPSVWPQLSHTSMTKPRCNHHSLATFFSLTEAGINWIRHRHGAGPTTTVQHDRLQSACQS